MDENMIKEQLDRIEEYSRIAAKNVLTIREASVILDMTPQGIRQKVREHEIPAYKPNQNRLYFLKEDLERWMLQNRSKTMDELEAEATDYCMKRRIGEMI